MFRQIVFFIRLCKLIAVTRYSDNVKRQYEIDKAGFEALLSLLSDDREEAGRLYERLRLGLIRFFQARGCSDCTGLADETLNRVAVKIGDFDPKLNNKPTSFIFGFAAKVFLEHNRSIERSLRRLESGAHSIIIPGEDNGDEEDENLDKLQKCLARLSKADRDLVLRYYSKEKGDRIKLRKVMARELGISTTALHTRIFRIRSSLKKCLEESSQESKKC